MLFVCTGNTCRSPMAEALLRAGLAERGVDAVVASTGLWEAGRPVPQESLTVMGRAGFDVSAHRSSVLSAPAIEGADLIVGLARSHVREVVLRDPSAFGRTFTLKELARRGEQSGPRGRDEPLRAWLDRVGQGRAAADFLGDDEADDVADPIGRSVEYYEQTRAELAELVDRLADLMA